MKSITLNWLKKHHACEDGIEWYKTLGTKNIDEVYEKGIEQEKYGYIIWYISEALERKDRIRFVVFCAELVLLIFEDKYPKDKRPRKAIEAAKAVIGFDNQKNRDAARAAARAARDASAAANAFSARAARAARAAAANAFSARAARDAAAAANAFSARAARAARDAAAAAANAFSARAARAAMDAAAAAANAARAAMDASAAANAFSAMAARDAANAFSAAMDDDASKKQIYKKIISYGKKLVKEVPK